MLAWISRRVDDQSAVLLRLLDLSDETLDAILDLRGRVGRGGPRLCQEGRGPGLRPEGQVVVGPVGLGVASDGGLDALVHAPLDRRPPFTLFRLLCQPLLLGSPCERTPEQDQQGECQPESRLHLPPLPLLGRGNLGPRPVELRLPRPLLGRRPEPGHRRRHLAARRPAGRPAPAPGTACTGRPVPAPPRTRPAGRAPRPAARGSPSAGPSRRPCPAYGGLPVRMTHRIAPRPNTSLARRSCRSRRRPAPGACTPACPARSPPGCAESGSRCERISVGRASRPTSAWTAAAGRSAVSIFASPQSMTCTSPNAPTMTFAGFRSRWMTPWAWAYPTAWHTCSKIGEEPPAVVRRVRPAPSAGRRGCGP